jgi:DNA invertase Pin-like site-specific DNA recombinase
MQKVLYIRVSTEEQNLDRQIKMGFNIIKDECSGSIAFFERAGGSKLKDMQIEELHVHSIDRLGRSTLDIMQTIQYFTNKGICVVSEKEGLKTIIDGKPNPIASLLIGVLGSIAEFELSRMKDRQREGIAKAKEQGRFLGRSKGSTQSDETFLNKHHKVVKLLKAGRSIRSIANDKTVGVSAPTVVKAKKILGLY